MLERQSFAWFEAYSRVFKDGCLIIITSSLGHSVLWLCPPAYCKEWCGVLRRQIPNPVYSSPPMEMARYISTSTFWRGDWACKFEFTGHILLQIETLLAPDLISYSGGIYRAERWDTDPQTCHFGLFVFSSTSSLTWALFTGDCLRGKRRKSSVTFIGSGSRVPPGGAQEGSPGSGRGSRLEGGGECKKM